MQTHAFSPSRLQWNWCSAGSKLELPLRLLWMPAFRPRMGILREAEHTTDPRKSAVEEERGLLVVYQVCRFCGVVLVGKEERWITLSGWNALPPSADIHIFQQVEPWISPASEMDSCTWKAVINGSSVMKCLSGWSNVNTGSSILIDMKKENFVWTAKGFGNTTPFYITINPGLRFPVLLPVFIYASNQFPLMSLSFSRLYFKDWSIGGTSFTNFESMDSLHDSKVTLHPRLMGDWSSHSHLWTNRYYTRGSPCNSARNLVKMSMILAQLLGVSLILCTMLKLDAFERQGNCIKLASSWAFAIATKPSGLLLNLILPRDGLAIEYPSPEANWNIALFASPITTREQTVHNQVRSPWESLI